MASTLRIRNGEVIRRDSADHDAGNRMRRVNRDLGDGVKRDGNNPFNEAFNFTADEYELLKKIKPELFDSDPHRRHKAWKAFAQSSEGKMFRVR